MKTITSLVVLGCLSLDGNAQLFQTRDFESYYTWDHNWKTNVYSITRVTPATLAPGDTKYFNGVDPFANWTKRVGLAWYFDRICPCNWGCDGRFCPWCANDDRMPWWYPQKKSLSADADVAGTADDEAVAAMGAIYDCNDPLEGGITITMEPVEAYDEEYEAQMITEYVEDWTDVETAFSMGATTHAFYWQVQPFSLSGIQMYIQNNLVNGVNIENDSYPQGIPVGPRGVKYNPVWWNYVYSRTPTYGGGASLYADFDIQDVLVPANQDILIWFSVFKQAIKGTLLADLVTSHATTGKPYITWRMDIPRANYFVYITSNDNGGWNYIYPLVNEVLCGPALNPAMCRTHDQQNGRIVNRFYGNWFGDVAPFINRTTYKWDIALEDPNNFYNTDFEQRHNMDIIAVDRLIVDGRRVSWREAGRRLEGFEDLDFTRGDYAYNVADPSRSFKLY